MPRPIRRLLIANRGEIAIRIARSAADAGIETVAVASEDDAGALHTLRADRAVTLNGRGAAAYLDIAQLVAAARAEGCDAIHPGYGFQSENAAFAEACEAAGLTFVGPRSETLAAFGDKAQARAMAAAAGAPVLAGSEGPVSAGEAEAFLRGLGEGAAIVLKAVSGGGGRGIRIATDPADVAELHARCASEAKAAFGADGVYVEQFLPAARHVEVQVIGDGTGAAVHAWERECSLQRRNQKILEIAPAPVLDASVRAAMLETAVRLAGAARYRGLGTFEFLVGAGGFYFMEANARIQVEHTVTEAVTGLDLVAIQLAIAGGATLRDLGLAQGDVPPPRGYAIQARVNTEETAADGTVKPTGGMLATFEPPTGPGVRVDTHGHAGGRTNPAFDSLLAKVIVHSPRDDFDAAVARLRRALAEFRIAPVTTNLAFLQALAERPEVAAGAVHTRFIDEHMAELVAAAQGRAPAGLGEVAAEAAPRAAAVAHAGFAVRAPLQGSIVSIDVAVGDAVRAGAQVAILDAMKMEHVAQAEVSGYVTHIAVEVGQAVFEGDPLLFLDEADVEHAGEADGGDDDEDAVRPDLAELWARRAQTRDEARPEAVARRRKAGRRMARENLADLCDPDSFMEYGSLVIAPQRRNRSLEDLAANTPADGLICGVATVNAGDFGPQKSRCVVLSYDYTVLAGTQGHEGHRKDGRMFELAEQWKLPVVFFAEGGGGRPGDTEIRGDGRSFNQFGRLSGKVPLVGVVSGNCFAGNAAFLGACDVIIATPDASIGMGGPVMIEGAGLGQVAARDVGPAAMHAASGVVDVLAPTEAEAVAAARRYLSYFQGEVSGGQCADQTLLRAVVPEDRRRAYDVRRAIEVLADVGSVLELRQAFGRSMVTSLARIGGKPLGIIANNPLHVGGAIDADGADKATRFMKLCDTFGLPILSLCDTPGVMVGPEAEKTALVRHSARMLVAGSNLNVPMFTVILRKAYGLGMIAMAGGSYRIPAFTVVWPTGEFGSMGLEGAVKLAHRKELDAIADPAERKARYEALVARMYEKGKALRYATVYDFDDVIDPADTRRWVEAGLNSFTVERLDPARRRTFLDTW